MAPDTPSHEDLGASPLDTLRYDARGLVTVIVQDRLSGEIRMLGHANREAVAKTLETKRATFFSRSRGALWVKGETSGNGIDVLEVWADCDRDALVYLAEPHGPTCHTGAKSCFQTRLDGVAREGGAAPMLHVLEDVLALRRAAEGRKSYTKSLLEGGAPKIAAKIREEGEELAHALEGEPDDHVVKESADVLFHLMVGLIHRGLSLRDVEAELAHRFGVSGHDEKASRQPGGQPGGQPQPYPREEPEPQELPEVEKT